MRYISAFAIIFLCASCLLAQSILTNNDVLEMCKVGLAPTVVISKINTSTVEFNTDTLDLKKLTEAGVPEVVITAMVERQAQKELPKKPVEYFAANAEHGDLSELRHKVSVYLAVDDLKARQIIVSAIQKDETLAIVDRRQDADFGLRFVMASQDVGSNALLGTSHNMVVVGELSAFTFIPLKPSDAVGRIRLLWATRKTQDFSGGLTLSRHPAQNAINDFLKAFKQINKR